MFEPFVPKGINAERAEAHQSFRQAFVPYGTRRTEVITS